MNNENYNIMQYSLGGGCGCKISPKDLSKILKSEVSFDRDLNLLIGNEFNDDAAVYSVSDQTAIISSTDFFTPITNDPANFGKIAAANSISDIYAMGGQPIMAIAILGFPVDKLPISIATQIMEGAREKCKEAGVILSGGHSINIKNPIFGLAVTGRIEKNKIKRNNTATAGCKLFLTKPLGTGILSTAEKKGVINNLDYELYINTPNQLNNIGQLLSDITEIKAMTDVTGFGLLGHLVEMCNGNNLSAHINFKEVPIISCLDKYIDTCTTGGSKRNWQHYKNTVNKLSEKRKEILCDPQSNGGLLIAIEEKGIDKLLSVAQNNNVDLFEIGEFKISDKNQDPCIIVS